MQLKGLFKPISGKKGRGGEKKGDSFEKNLIKSLKMDSTDDVLKNDGLASGINSNDTGDDLFAGGGQDLLDAPTGIDGISSKEYGFEQGDIELGKASRLGSLAFGELGAENPALLGGGKEQSSDDKQEETTEISNEKKVSGSADLMDIFDDSDDEEEDTSPFTSKLEHFDIDDLVKEAHDILKNLEETAKMFSK